jgi:hypothetical protein
MEIPGERIRNLSVRWASPISSGSAARTLRSAKCWARSSRCALRPRPKTCPTPRSPASRKPSSTCAARRRAGGDAGGVASLYNDRAISLSRAPGLRHALVALSAGVQRMVRSDLGASGVMFTLDTESGFRDVVFITSVLRPGRDGGAGRGQSGRVLRLQAALRAGKRAIVRRNLGSKLIKMEFYAAARARRQRVRTVKTVDTRRARALFAERRRGGSSWRARRCHRTALRPPDGHRVGQGRPGRQLYILQARPGDRAEPRRPQHRALRAQGSARACWPRDAASASRIGAGRCASCATPSMARVQPGDVLVADMTDPDWEPVMKRASRDRHQPRRPHLPRRDHRARTGHPGGGRLRRCDRACSDGAPSRCPAPRATPATSTTAC